jgi:hypothetical protein
MRVSDLLFERRPTLHSFAGIIAEADRLGVVLHGSEQPAQIVIRQIERKPGARTGTGGQIMVIICDYADTVGKAVCLTARGGDPHLIEFYKKYGFAVTGQDADGPTMCRRKMNYPGG